MVECCSRPSRDQVATWLLVSEEGAVAVPAAPQRAAEATAEVAAVAAEQECWLQIFPQELP